MLQYRNIYLQLKLRKCTANLVFDFLFTIPSTKEIINIIIIMSPRPNSFSFYSNALPGILHDALLSAAEKILKFSRISKRTFKANFGVTLGVVALAWEYTLQMSTEEDFVEPKHMLWTMMFLKQYYSSEDVMASQCDTTPTTFREHLRLTMKKLNACYQFVVSLLIFFNYFKQLLTLHYYTRLMLTTGSNRIM